VTSKHALVMARSAVEMGCATEVQANASARKASRGMIAACTSNASATAVVMVHVLVTKSVNALMVGTDHRARTAAVQVVAKEMRFAQGTENAKSRVVFAIVHLVTVIRLATRHALDFATLTMAVAFAPPTLQMKLPAFVHRASRVPSVLMQQYALAVAIVRVMEVANWGTAHAFQDGLGMIVLSHMDAHRIAIRLMACVALEDASVHRGSKASIAWTSACV